MFNMYMYIFQLFRIYVNMFNIYYNLSLSLIFIYHIF